MFSSNSQLSNVQLLFCASSWMYRRNLTRHTWYMSRGCHGRRQNKTYWTFSAISTFYMEQMGFISLLIMPKLIAHTSKWPHKKITVRLWKAKWNIWGTLLLEVISWNVCCFLKLYLNINDFECTILIVTSGNVDDFMKLVNTPTYPAEQKVLRLTGLPSQCSAQDICNYFDGLFLICPFQL